MIRNLKALGLALAAAFALSAIAASVASANNDHFTTSQSSALLTGVGTNHVFKITGATKEVHEFKCTTSKFTGTVENNATVATIDPTYTGKIEETPHSEKKCSADIGEITDIHENGCHYKLTGETTGHDEEKVDATIWIECPEGKKIEITSSLGPVISVPPQTPTTGGVVYTNKEEGGQKVVEVHATATGITYTCSTAFLCGIAGIATHCNDADYTGTVIATGYEDLDGLPTPITEGKQIPIEVSSTA